jgi:hypothetical protein
MFNHLRERFWKRGLVVGNCSLDFAEYIMRNLKILQ